MGGHLLLDALPAEAVERLVSLGGPGSGSPLTAVGSPRGPQEAESMRRQISLITGALAPYEAGRLLSLVDQPYDVAGAFSADALRRLREAKAAYDPHEVMHANYPVAPARGGPGPSGRD